MPKVSVITSTYNAAKTLGRACASLSRQLNADWEHIIVDDGSSDDGGRYAKQYANVEPRAFVIRTENRGIGAALNTGLFHATGEFIAFLDADDEYKANHIHAHVLQLQAYPAVDLLWGGLEVIADTEDQKYFPDMVRGEGQILVEKCCVTGTLFGRRSLFKKIPFSDDREIWCPDYEFLSRAKEIVKVRQFRQKTYVYYRNSPTSTFSQYHRMIGLGGLWNVRRKLASA